MILQKDGCWHGIKKEHITYYILNIMIFTKVTIFFSKIESDKVFKILKDFDERKAPAAPITQLCNLSFFSGRYPGAWQIAKLKILFKKSSKMNPKN